MIRERRFMKGAQVRSKTGDKPGIEGYAAVFNEEYLLYEDANVRLVETIAPGAFARALKEKQDVRGLFNHDAGQVLGRTTNDTLRLSQDKTGLHYELDLDTRTTCGQNVQAFVDRSDVTGCSFAFTVRNDNVETTTEGKMKVYTRTIKEIDMLYDVGPVTYPAYEATSVAPRCGRISAEMRNQLLRIEGLPAELRSAIVQARAKSKADECSCRCVACARDNDCGSCSDHMVDCGDEENCDHSRSKTPPTESPDINIDRQRAEAEIDGRMRRHGIKVA
jgi:HK97 family phage prohead protease